MRIWSPAQRIEIANASFTISLVFRLPYSEFQTQKVVGSSLDHFAFR